MKYNQKMAEKKMPWMKPDPQMVKASLRVIRDQLKARQTSTSKSASPTSRAKND